MGEAKGLAARAAPDRLGEGNRRRLRRGRRLAGPQSTGGLEALEQLLRLLVGHADQLGHGADGGARGQQGSSDLVLTRPG